MSSRPLARAAQLNRGALGGCAMIAPLTVLLALQSPILSSEMWPGEGVPPFVARATTLELYVEPSRRAAELRLTAKAGASIDFDDTRLFTERAGRVVAQSTGM